MNETCVCLCVCVCMRVHVVSAKVMSERNSEAVAGDLGGLQWVLAGPPQRQNKKCKTAQGRTAGSGCVCAVLLVSCLTTQHKHRGFRVQTYPEKIMTKKPKCCFNHTFAVIKMATNSKKAKLNFSQLTIGGEIKLTAIYFLKKRVLV